MRVDFSRWTTNQKLAGLAFVLGLLALAARPYAGDRVTINTKDLTAIVMHDADHVSAADLAGWIIQGRADYRLIDLRDAAAFAAYRIPTAEHVAVGALPGEEFLPTEKIVLCSADGTDAAQAWVLMKARGYRAVYVLRGGLEAWKNEVLFPVVAEHPTPDEAVRDARLRAVSEHFGGHARLAGPGGTDLAAPSMADLPVVAPPTLDASRAGAAKKPKKREGC